MLPLYDSWRRSPLTRSSIRRSCGSPISSGVTIHGPSGQKVSIALQNEKTPERISRRWMSRRDVVEDHVARDVAGSLLGREPLPRLADHDGKLELVVELVGQVLGVDHGLVRPDDRVDVLEEHDPRR